MVSPAENVVTAGQAAQKVIDGGKGRTAAVTAGQAAQKMPATRACWR